MMTNQRQRHQRLRLLAALTGLLVTSAALTACHSGAKSTAGPNLPLFGPATATANSAAGPWVTACDLLPDADIAAAANGYGTTITVTGHQAKETQNSPDDRISECDYAMIGVQGNGTLSGPEIIFTIDEVGALYYFPLRAGYERVDGVGDEAAWTSKSSPDLIVRVGKRLYDFDGRPPIMDTTANEQQDKQMDRDILLKIAKAALAKV